MIICLSLSIGISGCSTKAADVSAPDTTVAQTENNDGAAVEDEITETSGEQTSNPKPKVAAIPATEAGLYKAIGTCSELVIDPSDAQSSDPRVADGIAANVANCINDKFPQFYCGPIAMDDGSDASKAMDQ